MTDEKTKELAEKMMETYREAFEDIIKHSKPGKAVHLNATIHCAYKDTDSITLHSNITVLGTEAVEQISQALPGPWLPKIPEAS